MDAARRMPSSVLLCLLLCSAVCVDANRVNATKSAARRRSTSTGLATASPAPVVTTAGKVRVVLDHGLQINFEESSFARNSQPEPRGVQQRQKRLLNEMIAAQHWESDWMRLSQDELAGVKRSESRCVLPKYLEEQLNKTTFPHYDKDGNLVELAPAIIDAFKLYLACMGTCPVTYTWEDLGEQFFPRFIRRGFCSNDRPCSWPPGMRCKHNQTKVLMIYHHVCDGGDTEISLVNSNSTRMLDGTGPARRNNDLRSVRTNSASENNSRNVATSETRRSKNESNRKKRKNGGANGNGNANGKRNRNGGKKKENQNQNQNQNQKQNKRDAPNRAGQNSCRWDMVAFPVTSMCSCSCA